MGVKKMRCIALFCLTALFSVAASAQNIRISDLPASAPLTGRESIPVSQSGSTKQTSPAQIGTYLNSTFQPLDQDLSAIAGLSTQPYGRQLLTYPDAPTARNALGLGTAATANTGTSGSNIPLLNTNNTWSQFQSFTTVGIASLFLANGSNYLNWIMQADGNGVLYGLSNAPVISYRADNTSPLLVYVPITLSKGAVSSKYCYSGTLCDFAGSGSPQGTVTASIGSTYRRTDGGAGSAFYVKESGSDANGWVAK